MSLRLHLEAASPELHPRNNAALVSHTKGLLDKQASADPDAGNPGWLAQKSFDFWNPASDQTGITAQPGRGDARQPHRPAGQRAGRAELADRRHRGRGELIHADFGSEGTLEAPKVYDLITGSTGVFLPRFTNKEMGVREVLLRTRPSSR